MHILPNQPGMSSFLGGLGVSCGPIVIGFLIQYLVNPYNSEPTVTVYEGKKLLKYFDESIARNLPVFFMVLGTYMCLAGLICPFFMVDISDGQESLPSQEKKENMKKTENQDLNCYEIQAVVISNQCSPDGSKRPSRKNSREVKGSPAIELEENLLQVSCNNETAKNGYSEETKLADDAKKISRSFKYAVLYFSIVFMCGIPLLFLNYFKMFC